MHKAVANMMLMGLALAAFTMTASAQIKFKATLPFAFQVGNTNFNAGAYSVIQEPSTRKLTIRAEKGNQSLTLAAASLPPKGIFEPAQTWLVFHRYGDKYFLSEVWSKHLGLEMPLSAAERQLRDSGAQMVPVKVNVHT